MSKIVLDGTAHRKQWQARAETAERTLAERDAELAAARAALMPFVAHYEPWMDYHPDHHTPTTFSRMTFGQLRAARAALKNRTNQPAS